MASPPAVVEELLIAQNARILLLRPGMTIRRLDGPGWLLVGHRGRLLDTLTDSIVVECLINQKSQARVRDDKIYGIADLKENMFVIANGS